MFGGAYDGETSILLRQAFKQDYQICKEIEIRDIQELRPYDTKKVFTYEKLMLIDKDEYDKNFWLDLDLLIHKDITDIITRPHNNITFRWFSL